MLRAFMAMSLIFGINSPLLAIDAVYEGSNGIRDKVLTACLQCHSASVTDARRNGAPSIVNFDTYTAAATWSDLLITRAVTERSMPPSGPLSAEQRAALLAWQAAGFPEKSAVPATTTAQPDCLFNWAETSLPDLLSPRAQSRSAPPYYYRFYPPGTYLAIAASRLLYFGPLSPTAILDLGDVATWYPQARCN